MYFYLKCGFGNHKIYIRIHTFLEKLDPDPYYQILDRKYQVAVWVIGKVTVGCLQGLSDAGPVLADLQSVAVFNHHPSPHPFSFRKF
jgi:hypothetical protein